MAKTKSKRVTPKRLAGVKVPKALRRNLDELLTSPAGHKLMAEALLAAGALTAGGGQARKASKTRKLVAGHVPEDVKAATLSATESVSTSGALLAQALGEAVQAFVGALRNGAPERGGKPGWPPIEPAGKGAAPPGGDAPPSAH